MKYCVEAEGVPLGSVLERRGVAESQDSGVGEVRTGIMAVHGIVTRI